MVKDSPPTDGKFQIRTLPNARSGLNHMDRSHDSDIDALLKNVVRLFAHQAI
jgi:hypothetical protein